MRKPQIVVFIMFITLIFAKEAYTWQSPGKYEGKVIKDIKLQGLVNTDKFFIYGVLTVLKGQKLDSKKIRQNFKMLYEMRYFESIEIKATPKDGGVVLIFIFVELPKIGVVAIEGEDEIKEKDILHKMILKPGNVFNKADLAKDERNILKMYKEKGFDGTIVQVRARVGANNKLVNIIVQIVEGKEVFVESVKIIGTKVLDPDDIYDKMQTKETTLLRTSQVLDEAKLLLDKRIILQFMKDNGFIFGKIKSIKIKKDYISKDDPDDSEQGYFVVIEIEEGERYKMGKVKLSGNRVVKSKELYPLIKSKEGDLYNDTKFKRDLNTMMEIYKERGYIQIQVIPTEKVDEKNKIVNFDLEFVEGDKVHIESIRIMGHEKTKTWVIDRELRLFEGEIYNQKKLKKSLERILNTQYFSNVLPSTVPGTDDGLIELQIKVTEQRTGLITVGAGYGSILGITGFEEIQEKNLFGSGWGVRQRFEMGEIRTNAEVGTFTNWLLPYVPIRFNFNFRYLRQITDAYYSMDQASINYNFLRQGGKYAYLMQAYELDFVFGYFLGDHWLAYTGFLVQFSKASEMENFSMTDIDSTNIRGRSLYADLEAGLAGNYLRKLSHRASLVFDTRDLTLNTRNGVKIQGTFTYTGGVYGGDSQWLQWHNSFAFYINPVWDIVFASFASYTMHFEQFDGSFSIRDVDRLRFDGMNELRGYRSINIDEVVGQGGKISFIQEIRFPLFEEILWSVVFADAGDVTDELGSLPGHVHYFSFGFGFRVQIPLIPIRLYFAKKADYNTTMPGELYFRPDIEVIFTIGGFF